MRRSSRQPLALANRHGEDTRAGVILGTAAYITTSSARTGRRQAGGHLGVRVRALRDAHRPRAFARDTLTDTLAAVVQSDPDWLALPRRHHRRDPRSAAALPAEGSSASTRDIGDARLDIEDAIAAPDAIRLTHGHAVDRRRVTAWFVAGLIVASVITAAMLLLGRRQPDVAATDLTLTIAPPSASGIQPVESYCPDPRSSPDGSVVAYHDRMGTLQLRRLNAVSPQPLRATRGFSAMIWSADSNYLVYPDDTTLKRIRVPDGAPEIIGRLPAAFPAGSMSESGMLLFFCCLPGTTRVCLVPARDAQAEGAKLPEVSHRPPCPIVRTGFLVGRRDHEENEILPREPAGQGTHRCRAAHEKCGRSSLHARGRRTSALRPRRQPVRTDAESTGPKARGRSGAHSARRGFTRHECFVFGVPLWRCRVAAGTRDVAAGHDLRSPRRTQLARPARRPSQGPSNSRRTKPV